jgi:hypothetical protein
MAKTTQKCPVCDSIVPAEANECPSCGLPRDIWPDVAPETVVPVTPLQVANPPPAKKDVPEDKLTTPTTPKTEVMAPSRGPTPEVTHPKAEVSKPKAEVTSPSTKPPVEKVPEKTAPQPPPRIVSPPQREIRKPLPFAPEKLEPSRTHVIKPTGTGAAFEGVTDEIRVLMEVATKYSIDVGTASQTLTRATQLLRLQEGERARSLATAAIEQLRTAIAEASQTRIDEMKRTVERLGQFAPSSVTGKMALLDVSLVRGDFDRLLPDIDVIMKELDSFEKGLGVIGRLIKTIGALEEGIETLGGKPSAMSSFIEKAYDAYSKGQTKDAEAILGIALGEVAEALSPLMIQQLSKISARLKDLHDKGKEVRDLAVMIKQAAFSLRSRNLMQVLTLLPILESKLAAVEGVAKLPPEAPKEDEEKEEDTEPRIRRIRGHARITSSSPSSTTTTSSEPPPIFKGDRPPLKRGSSYLLFEAHPSANIMVFLDAKGVKKGLLLTTTFPPKILEDTPMPDTEIVWMSESSGWKTTVNPKTLDHEISAYIFDFLRQEDSGSLCIDGLGHLISSNGFPRVEKFLKSVLDFASSRSVTVIATLLTGSLDEKNVVTLKGMFDFSD